MDSVTQFLLGASVSAAILGPRHGMKTALIGGLIATLPDLDTFMPHENVMEAVTRHRGFSHSLIVQTAISPVLALGLKKLLPREGFDYRQLLLTVWLVLITHSLLDALTTYGTQIFWPLEVGPPAAFPSVFIIDPVYTLTLLAGVLGFLFIVRRNPFRARKVMVVFLMTATAYLGIGMAGHMIIKNRAMADPLLAGKRVHVQPTPFNILYWQVLAVDDTHYYSGATSLLRGCGLIDVTSHPRNAGLRFHARGGMLAGDDSIELPASARRYEWFTDGFYSYRETGDGLQISDLRIGYAPVFPFSFKIAEKRANGYMPIEPQRVPGRRERMAQLSKLYKLAQIVPKGCWSRS